MNGYCMVSRTYTPDDTNSGLLAIEKVNTGTLITDYEHQDAGFFEDGYCSVKKNDQ